MRYIDIHTHIFPDKIAGKAIEFLEDYYHHRWPGAGSRDDLLKAMDDAGVEKAVIFSCATKAEQVVPANDFLEKLHSSSGGRFIAFGTLHPDFQDCAGELERIRQMGLKGVKFHPDFQKIYLDEPKMLHIYSLIGSTLPMILHMGDRRTDFSSPWRLARVLDMYPEMKVVAAHFGGYSEWDEVKKYLVGRNVLFDTSSTFWELPANEAREIALAHGTDKLLFGSDYPASLPREAINDVLSMDLSDDDYEKIFFRNAAELLGLEQ